MHLPPMAFLSLVCLGLGLAAGFVMHRSDFCLAGMFRDLFLFRSAFLLRILLLLAVVTMLGVEGARLLGWLPVYPFYLLAPPSLATLLGGAVFGVGMVLAGGCVVGTLYKMGSGSPLSWVAFAGLIAGSGLYAEFHPAWQSVFQTLRIGPEIPTLTGALGIEPTWAVLVLTAAASPWFLRWWRRGEWSAPAYARGYLQPWKAALMLSGITLLSYLVVGMPLGITTFYAKLAAAIESLLIPEHVAQLAYFQAAPLDGYLPALGIHLSGGAGPRWDGIGYVQGPLILGIVGGAFLSSVLLREFQFHSSVPPRQLLSGFAGGVALALGSRMSSGCNVWYLLGGLPVLATQSFLFLGGMLGGTWLGSLLLTRYVLPDTARVAMGGSP